MALTINPPLQLTKGACQVRTGSQATAISFSVNRTGGTGAIVTWTQTGLPFGGLSFNTSTGVISGTPNAANNTTHSVTVTGTDASGSSSSVTFTITFVNGQPNPAC
jgi:hypothetical protein